jgi:hypothetical protein
MNTLFSLEERRGKLWVVIPRGQCVFANFERINLDERLGFVDVLSNAAFDGGLALQTFVLLQKSYQNSMRYFLKHFQ